MVIILNLTSKRACYDRYDYRIKYLNLKNTRSQNSLALEDVQRLWIPFLVFDNTEKNEATKVNCLNRLPLPVFSNQKKIIGNQPELLVHELLKETFWSSVVYFLVEKKAFANFAPPLCFFLCLQNYLLRAQRIQS